MLLWVEVDILYILIFVLQHRRLLPSASITSYYSQSDNVNIIIYKIFADNFTVNQCSTTFILFMLLWVEVDIYINECPIAPSLATFCINCNIYSVIQYCIRFALWIVVWRILLCCNADLTWFAVWWIRLQSTWNIHHILNV